MKHNDFLAYVLERAGQLGAVTKRDVSPWEVIHKSAMKFRVEAYEISGIGYLSVIRMSAMLGLMKMDTAVLTPVCKDAPLFSYDIIHALGNDTLLLELYDTQLQAVELGGMDAVKARYAHLPDNDLGKHWYDHLKLSPTLSKKGKKLTEAYEPLCREWFDAYLEVVRGANDCGREEKQAKVAEYVDGLFEHGGPSTDQFKKLIGEEEAKALFHKFVFSSRT